MTENGPWTPRDHQQDPLDPRCDAVDAAIDAALDATAPRDVPIGLVDRVSQASLQQLRAGQYEASRRLVFRPLARLAMAACVLLAVVAAFWLVGRQPAIESRSVAHRMGPEVVLPTSIDPTGSVARFQGLKRVSDLDFANAIGSLEGVVFAVRNGAGSNLVISPGQTNMETIENELDSVRVVARMDG
ncbi:MAG: hypothetical protein HOO04_00880 [Phycisphaerae bacterium]|nr:hypothetical protein [Phycisphaerae bacterium]MBT5382139.1 hypothetical protein [Phycisphaerae bacterium]